MRRGNTGLALLGRAQMLGRSARNRSDYSPLLTGHGDQHRCGLRPHTAESWVAFGDRRLQGGSHGRHGYMNFKLCRGLSIWAVKYVTMLRSRTCSEMPRSEVAMMASRSISISEDGF